MKLRLAPVLLVLCLLGAAPAAMAAPALWDAAKVTELSRDLEVASRLLYDSFEKLPPLEKGSAHTRQYFRLKQEVRHLMRESRWLARALEKGHAQEEAQPAFESISTAYDWARKDAEGVATNADFQQKADAVGKLVAALAPFFGTSAETAAAP
jgi:hypothetical protein